MSSIAVELSELWCFFYEFSDMLKLGTPEGNMDGLCPVIKYIDKLLSNLFMFWHLKYLYKGEKSPIASWV